MSDDASQPPCEILEWDSTFFGRRIARMNGGRATAAHADAVLAWCAANHVACLYFLADLDDAETVRAVEQRGFALVDARLTLGLRTASARRAVGVRPARLDDLPALEAMARINHTDSRFYYDGHFSRAQCDELYATWIKRSCEGWADAVLVAQRGGEGANAVAGYITCHVSKDPSREAQIGSIGLLGVGEASQGQGLGGALIDAALEYFDGRGIERVEVVTQGRNVRAQRAYQRRGFVSERAQLWFHRWFSVDARTV